MKYTVSIDIDLPRDRVVELFDSTDNLYEWQRGLESFELVAGEAGQPGAQSKLVYTMGNRRVEMLETITVRDLPERFEGTYDAKGVHNVVSNRFLELGPQSTRWESENEFRFSGLMKLMAFFMRGAFPKQSLRYMEDFKAFAEEGKSVRGGDG